MRNKQNFIQIFENDHSIVIPSLQRDYAQGRTDPHANQVRADFLESLYQAVTSQPIVLDFIYGDINSEGVVTLLDGQQRVTTLFLLYWYAAKKANLLPADYAFLKRFSYQTRPSSRDFCKKLVDYQPDFTVASAPSIGIEDQNWFPLSWKKDPTIRSMLVMLDAIDAKFRHVDGLWSRLASDCITFYFLPIDDMGLTDELYIKMNSRGKPLTEFEIFKAELESALDKVDHTTAQQIAHRIDGVWTDLLWHYKELDYTVDDAFLNCFRHLCQVICFRSGDSLRYYDKSNSSLIKYFFSPEPSSHLPTPDPAMPGPERKAQVLREVRDNVDYMRRFFDLWTEIQSGGSTYQSIHHFFEQFIATRHTDGKIRLPGAEVDLFRELALQTKDDDWSLSKLMLFYAFNVYLEHRATLPEADFRRRIRIINNLIQNSSDLIRDDEKSPTGNRIPAMLAQIERIILEGVVEKTELPSFNTYQLKEEKDKLWLTRHPDRASAVFALEDHDLLYGQIGIIGTDDTLVYLFPRFADLFQCSRDKVNRAMMAVGDYAQFLERQGRFQLGVSSDLKEPWQLLFHHSSFGNYEETSRVLVELLKSHELFSDEILDRVADDYLVACEKAGLYDWRYYYVKYSAFRPTDNFYGKYFNVGGYGMLALPTKDRLTKSAYSPFLEAVRELSDHDLTLDYFNNARNLLMPQDGNLSYNFDEHNICIYDTNRETAEGTYEITQTIPIEQNTYSIDLEDRIQKMAKLITNPQPE